MTVLTPDVPLTVSAPSLLVENKLAPGKYRFRLVVIDDQGLSSEPTELTVSILEASPPPPRDTPVGPGPILSRGTVSPTLTPAPAPIRPAGTAPTPPIRPIRPS